ALQRRVLAGVLIALVGLSAVAVFSHRPLLKRVATALVVEDHLDRSDAIVVVAGGTPSREAVAARLFREQWAPRIIISRPFTSDDLRQLTALGVRRFDLQGESRAVLERFGVPADRIVAVPEAARTTEPELDLVPKLARARDYRRVIRGTSRHH